MPTPPHRPASRSPSTPRSQLHSTSPEITTRYSPEVLKRMEGDICYRCNQIGHWSWHCPLTTTPTPPHASNSPEVVKKMQGDICYRCNKRGHRSSHCPLTSPNNNKCLSPSPKTDSPLNPAKIFCRCGHGFCVVETSRSERNPGRKYYVCPIKRGKPCREFVQWCDRPVDESYMQPPPYKYPECECGAGVCQKVKDPDAADKDCFVCPVGMDHGSCGFKVSEDELLDNCKNIVPIQPSRQKHLGHCPTGWLGRLLFLQPTRSLKFPAPQPFFCCIFPSFDLIAVPKQAITFDDRRECNQQLAITDFSEHAQLSSNGCHTEVSRDVLGHSEVSGDDSVSPPSQSSHGSKRKPMSTAERERHAGLGLQQALLNYLDSLDPHEKRMAAKDTFVILDLLSVDYK